MAGQPKSVREGGKQKAFLAAFTKCGSITEAASLANTTRQRHYEWLQDPEYKAAFNVALEESIELLEREARRRALEGTTEPVFYKGDVCGSIQKYSDTLAIFLLKAHRPQRYRDNATIEHVGAAGGPIKVLDLSNLTDEQLTHLEALALAVTGPGEHPQGAGAQGNPQTT